MEPQNGGLEDDVPFPQGVDFKFHLNFQGCNDGFMTTKVDLEI